MLMFTRFQKCHVEQRTNAITIVSDGSSLEARGLLGGKILAYKIGNHQQNKVFIQRGHHQAPFRIQTFFRTISEHEIQPEIHAFSAVY